MKPHLRRVLRAAALLSTTAVLALLPVTAAEAAAKIEVRPHNALGTVLAGDFWWAAAASTRRTGTSP